MMTGLHAKTAPLLEHALDSAIAHTFRRCREDAGLRVSKQLEQTFRDLFSHEWWVAVEARFYVDREEAR